MNLDQIKVLIDLLEKHPLQEIRYNFSSEESIHLVKEKTEPAALNTQEVLQKTSLPSPVVEKSVSKDTRETSDSNCKTVQSPIVGTFYTSSSPEKPPFVHIGDTVKKDQTLCIIEAMKILNPITAPCSGTIKKICLDNEAPVEYNQELFVIEP